MKAAYEVDPNPLAAPVMKSDADNPHPVMPHVQSMRPMNTSPNAWRDIPFAIAFFAVVLATLVLAAMWGIPVMNGTSKNNSNLFEMKGSISNFFYIGLVMCVVAAALSFLVLKFMIAHAKSMIQFALWFQVGLSAVAALAAIMFGQIFVAIIAVIFLCISICYARLVRHRIPFASANLKVSAEAIKKHSSAYGVAVLFLLIQIVWIILWSIGLFGVMDKMSSNTGSTVHGPQQRGSFCLSNSDCATGYCSANKCAQATQSSAASVVFYFLLLALYWGISVCRNVTHCSIVGTVATWWYATDSSNATGAALKRSCTTSFGSICFGSLVVAIIQVLKSIASSARRDGSCLGCIAECILGCLENLVQYFNRWAYVYVGIYGYKYLQAGKAVISLFQSRGFDAIINDDLIQNVLMLTAFAVGVFSAVLSVGAYYMYPDMMDFNNAPIVMGILGFVIGTGIAFIPLSVIDSSVATVFVCFVEDPSVFARTHGDLYSDLVTEWHRLYPDVIVANGYYYA